jgi:hypothetical protein
LSLANGGLRPIFEAAEVAVSSPSYRPRAAEVWRRKDGVVATDLDVMGRAEVVPIGFGAFGPIGGAVDRAAVEEQRLARVLRGEAVFLTRVEAVDAALHIVPAGGWSSRSQRCVWSIV